jgi:hypothetical protein
MLQIPQKNFNRSVGTINIKTDVLADWIESSLLFDDNEISKSDLVDVLIEENICEDSGQDLANEIADRGWVEIEQRKSWGGVSANLEITGPRLKGTGDWRSEPIRAFFLLLSVLRLYPEWSERHRNYVEQGELFEKVVEVICPALLPGWKVFRAGWSPENPVTVKTIVPLLCEHLHTRGADDLDDWLEDAAKDGGLDIVCFRSFPDQREATPTFFLQCASGTNWRDKLHTPSANKWKKYLNAAVQPSTGIVAPFVIDTKKVRLAGLEGQIIVFDRIRLLYAMQSENVELSNDLKDEVIAWVETRANDIPKLN